MPNTARIDVGYDAVLHYFAFCSPIISRVVIWRKDEVYLGAGSAEIFGSERVAMRYLAPKQNPQRLFPIAAQPTG
jgi:hypothetical protein